MTDLDPAITPEFPPKAAFRKWLRSLPADEVVAERWESCNCPLANWMQKSGSARHPNIESRRWRASFHAVTAPLPEWAVKFVERIDHLGNKTRGRGAMFFGPVTAADCLRVLAGTPRA